jgi:polysaccharide biosynthesis/export protein
MGGNMIASIAERPWLTRGRSLLVCAIAIATLSACMTAKHPPAPRDAGGADYDYRIGPLDTVAITVWRNPELSLSVPVRPDGKINTPLIDDMPAVGKTPTELERDLEKALTKLIRDPVVTVVVTTFVGQTNEQIRVTGEAARPQIVAYRRGMTLLDLMIAVGGLTDFADGNAATIYRVAEGGKQYSVRLHDLLKRGDISANVDLRPGDILLIPQSWF